MTATRQDKAEWEATHRLREAGEITVFANDALAIAAAHFVVCEKPDQARACQEIAYALEAQAAAIDDLYRRLTAEEEQ